MKQFANVKLKEASDSDLELIMAWRSHPKVYQFFHEQDSPLKWEEHIQFWETRENRKDWIILYKGANRWRKVGSINVSKLHTKSPEVGIFIGEITLWGHGVGAKALAIVLDWLESKEYNQVRARVSKDNKISQKLFEKMGFSRKKSVTEGKEWLYQVAF